MQISLMVGVLLEESGVLQLSMMLDLLIAGVVVSTVVSGMQYVWQWGIKRELEPKAPQ